MRPGTRVDRRRGFVGLAVGVCLAAAVIAGTPRTIASASGSSASGVVFFSIRVAPDYATSHTIFAAGTELDCRSDCRRLYRSTDAGHTWQRAAATGWTTGDAWPAVSSRGPLLLAAGPSAMEESWDAGEHFSTVSAPAGAVDVTSAGAARAIVVDSNDHWHLLDVATLAVQDVPGATGTLQYGAGFFVGSGTASGGVAGLAAGTSVASGHPALARCTATWQCDTPSDIESASDGVIVQPSSDFAHDDTVFARSGQHGTLFRSTDAGHTFTAVTVAPSSDITTASVQGLAFSADFDAAAPHGSVFAAVATAGQGAGAPAPADGGVFVSRDGGVSWQHLGAPSELDHGVVSVAATSDGRVLAAFLDGPAHNAGLLCTVDGRTWQASCPTSASGGGSSAGRSAPAGSSSRAGAVAGGAAATAPVSSASAGNAARQPTAKNGASAAAASTGGGRGVLLGVAVAVAVLAGLGWFWLRRLRRGYGTMRSP